MTKIEADEERIYNINDHSGYRVSELFVKQKYRTFKEEIANYPYLLLIQYRNEVVTKANEYVSKDIVKATSAIPWQCKKLHYDIKKGTLLGWINLVGIILYTDYSNLCTHFSGTFRKKTPYETVESIKRRNSHYWWMSKILRETVEIFGGHSYDGTLLGPYYCGVSVVLSVPSFNIRLCSPTSTSSVIEVAMKFSGEEGMVIELTNPPNIQYGSLTGFNCAWISRYKEEEERLFCGGERYIKIVSIRIKSTKQNFQKFIYALWYFDIMVCGGDMYENQRRRKIKRNMFDEYVRRMKDDDKQRSIKIKDEQRSTKIKEEHISLIHGLINKCLGKGTKINQNQRGTYFINTWPNQ
eukprot:329491_1